MRAPVRRDASGAGPPVRPRRRGARSGRPRRNRRSAGEGRDDGSARRRRRPVRGGVARGSGAALSDRRTSRTRDRSRSTCPPNRSGRGRESGRSSGGPRGPPSSVRARWCSTTASTSDSSQASRTGSRTWSVHLRDSTARCRISADTTGSTNSRTSTRTGSRRIRRRCNDTASTPSRRTPWFDSSRGTPTTTSAVAGSHQRGNSNSSNVSTSTGRCTSRPRANPDGGGRILAPGRGDTRPVGVRGLLRGRLADDGDRGRGARNARGADERVRWRRRHEQLPGVGDGVRAVTVVRRRGRRRIDRAVAFLKEPPREAWAGGASVSSRTKRT